MLTQVLLTSHILFIAVCVTVVARLHSSSASCAYCEIPSSVIKFCCCYSDHICYYSGLEIFNYGTRPVY